MTLDGPSETGVTGIVAFIGIGSNIADPVVQCRNAVNRLGEAPGIHLLRRSSLYRTEPIGPKDQAWFINAVAEIRTALPPGELLGLLKAIERKMGRRSAPRWGPRVIDLDILLYGQMVVNEDGLVIPHPELHRRRFVLEPLCELAPYAIHPAYGVSARGLLDRLTDQSVVERMNTEMAGT